MTKWATLLYSTRYAYALLYVEWRLQGTASICIHALQISKPRHVFEAHPPFVTINNHLPHLLQILSYLIAFPASRILEDLLYFLPDGLVGALTHPALVERAADAVAYSWLLEFQSDTEGLDED